MSFSINSDLLSQKSWPFQEAYKLIARAESKGGVPLVFETGYGPSGLPHIGTFGEFVRTAMIRRAFQEITDYPTRIICFSDDLDGLRKIPDNIPNPSQLTPFLNYPLTQVPDPFGTHPSFGEHNNALLRAFLDSFGFEYEFMSATQCYRSGIFDQTLLKVLRNVPRIMEVVLPTLGQERQQTYSPFFPISPSTGRVLQVPIRAYNLDSGSVVFQDEDGKEVEVPVTGGHCKLQWKVDWAMRWIALGVDYEIYGKDLFIGSVGIAQEICRILGGQSPDGFSCELFLDESGRKISKSKGNGLSTDDWLRYGPPSSLSYFMFHAPKRAKSLCFGSIPKSVDELLGFLRKYPDQNSQEQRDNPVWHVFKGDVVQEDLPISFNLLLNLVGVCGGYSKELLWRFVARYLSRPDVEKLPAEMPTLDALCGYAVTYYQDFIAPYKSYGLATQEQRCALEDLEQALILVQEQSVRCHKGHGQGPGEKADEVLPHQDPGSPEALQALLYDMGKKHFSDLKVWFHSLYRLLLGQEEGPRMGSFMALFGIEETRRLIRQALERQV
jgi:lysyl-tRNA synthetase, class I